NGWLLFCDCCNGADFDMFDCSSTRGLRRDITMSKCTGTPDQALHAFSAVVHGIGQNTEPLDLHFEEIAMLHKNRWLTRRSDTTRRAGDDHSTSLQTHRDTDHCNQR